ncbi:hypothetical protein [Nocardia sp. NBC_01503]|uniref:hypothetical protein n=1 Tax=Nocardia sp. NBC_01503 TaxID=2975997 RepID=UPI002E7AE98E|nr:hypothetical protein [Nocardia sp. NBC_01503]
MAFGAAGVGGAEAAAEVHHQGQRGVDQEAGFGGGEVGAGGDQQKSIRVSSVIVGDPGGIDGPPSMS